MPYASLQQSRVFYEVSGPSDGVPLLMIHGLGCQLIQWYPDLVSSFEAAGFNVIRFDHRDVGLTSTFDGEYSLSDMAVDAYQLVGFLGLEKIHVVGQSLGGMIAQLLAISYPRMVSSLTSIYSASSNEFVTRDPKLRESHPASSLEEAVEQFCVREQIGGDAFDVAFLRAMGEEIVRRDYDRELSNYGRRTHANAFSNSPDRTPELERLNLPASVIHGRLDRLVNFEGGIATAKAIPGCELHLFADMGHQLRPDLWADYVRIVSRTVARANS